jgi:hypothetical protein
MDSEPEAVQVTRRGIGMSEVVGELSNDGLSMENLYSAMRLSCNKNDVCSSSRGLLKDQGPSGLKTKRRRSSICVSGTPLRQAGPKLSMMNDDLEYE